MFIDSHSSSGDARHTRDVYLSLDAVEALQFLIVGSCDGNKCVKRVCYSLVNFTLNVLLPPVVLLHV